MVSYMIFNENFSKIRTSLLIALAESVVLCYWLNIDAYLSWRYGGIGTASADLASCVFICLCLYLFLYRMYGSKLETFIYSICFLSCCHAFCFFTVNLNTSMNTYNDLTSYNPPAHIVFIFTLLFVLIFYSYAALCECDGKPDAATFLFLAVTGTLFTVLSLAELLFYNFTTVTICLPLFGTYFICCLLLKKAILSIRIFSWSMFWPSLAMFIIYFMYAINKAIP